MRTTGRVAAMAISMALAIHFGMAYGTDDMKKDTMAKDGAKAGMMKKDGMAGDCPDKGAMGKEGMKKDSMGQTAMAGDSMKKEAGKDCMEDSMKKGGKDSMKDSGMAHEPMGKDAMKK